MLLRKTNLTQRRQEPWKVAEYQPDPRYLVPSWKNFAPPLKLHQNKPLISDSYPINPSRLPVTFR